MALNWPQPGDAVDLGRVDEVLDGLANWCEATALLPDQETRQRLQRQVTAVREKREQLLSPLLIAIIGGTGVGKSSLLNALAGGPIAAASARRPTTQQVTVYLHEDNLLALEPGEWAAAQVRHQRAELLDRILIDTPDYDSVDLSHRRRMQTVLALADVVIFVTTREKYADLAGAEWLRQYREGRLFLFVLNRADEGVPPEVVPDLRRHLAELGFAGAEPLVLSATAALAARQELAPPLADFVRLEGILRDELDAKRARAVKEGNLEALVRRLVGQALAAVPADLGERLEAWRQRAERAYDELRSEIAARLLPRLGDDPRLPRHVEYWFGTGFGGPVGAGLTLLYGLRAALLPVYPRLWELSDAPTLEPLADEEADVLAARVRATQAQLAAMAVESGLPGGAERLPAPESVGTRGLAQRVDDRLRQGIGRAVRLTRDEVAPGWRPLALALNLPLILGLVGLPGYFVYDRIGAFWHENIIPAGPFLQAAATVLLLWLALGMLVGQGLVRRRTRRFLGSLREMVAQAVDEVLRPRLLERLDEHHAELRDEQQVLARWATEFGARR